MIEQILRDLAVANPKWSIALLRYFNPIGAHVSGRELGEDPNGIPNNLMPYIAQVAVGKLERLSVYGDDYETPDGTGVRDYIHVVDLALGHLKALDALKGREGVRRLEFGRSAAVTAFWRWFGPLKRPAAVRFLISLRASGPVISPFHMPAQTRLTKSWDGRLKRGIEQMCADSWRWQSANPDGYPDEE